MNNAPGRRLVRLLGGPLDGRVESMERGVTAFTPLPTPGDASFRWGQYAPRRGDPEDCWVWEPNADEA